MATELPEVDKLAFCFVQFNASNANTELRMSLASVTYICYAQSNHENAARREDSRRKSVAYQAYPDRTSCGVLQQLPARQLLLPKLSKVSFVYKELHGSRAAPNGVLAP